MTEKIYVSLLNREIKIVQQHETEKKPVVHKYKTLKIVNANNIQFAKATGNDCMDIYNVDAGTKVCSASLNAKVEFIPVLDKVFVKVTEIEGEYGQYLYDEDGFCIDYDAESDLLPVFCGSEICIERRNNGKVSLSTIEGYLV